MTKLDTGAIADVTTQSEASGQTEIRVGSTVAPRKMPTEAHCAVGSVPSGLPEVMETGEYGYVFRIGSPRSAMVTITLETKQLMEQAQVRKVNQAIRRARRR